jgi:predicted porin
MKRVLVPTLMAVACGAAMAQSTSSVTLYGIVDAGVTYTTGLAKNKTQLVSGIMDGSRFGLRGNEDLGGGYRAIFTLENRTELNNGSGSSRPPTGTQVPDRLNQAALLGLPAALQPAVTGVAAQIGSTLGVNLANNFWDRQAYVGLVTPFGAVLAGRQYTPVYEINATFETLATQSSLSLGQVGAIPSIVDIRVSNALQYRIQLGGLTASAMYAFGGVTGNDSANRFGGAMAMYKGEGYGVGVGYQQRNNDIGLESLKTLQVGGYFGLGPGAIHAVYADIQDDNPSGVSGIAAGLTPLVGAAGAALVQSAYTVALKQDAQVWQLGYRMTTGPNTFYVAYNSYDDRKAVNADVASYGIVYSYALSKRTDLNAVYTHFDNKGLGQAAPGQAGFLGGFTETAAADANNFAFGIRHRF